MSLDLGVLLASVPVLLLVEAFFSGSEIALLAADKLVLRTMIRQGSAGARTAFDLARRPERILSTTLLMTTLSVISVSVLVSLYLHSEEARSPELLTVVVTSPLVVIFGELIPKTLFQKNATRVAPWVARPVQWTYLAFYPLTRFVSTYTSQVTKFIAPIEEMIAGRSPSTRENLRSLLAFGKSETEIKASERRMIRRILDFGEVEARHSLIPLVKVEAIDKASNVGAALEAFARHRHSRVPVFSERVDNIVGVLEAMDLVGARAPEESIESYVSPAVYVPESQPLKDVLHDLRREDNQLVVVVDEYGGAVGILTFEDIVEEIVGDIQDEYDAEPALIKSLEADRWIIQARVETTVFNETVGGAVPEGMYETLGGFLLQQFGRIPEPRDELHFGGFRFTIRTATSRAILTVLVEKMTQAAENR